MVILRKTSLIDFPGRIASVIFFFGCNLRCPWCQNPLLVLGHALDSGDDHSLKKNCISLDQAFAHIEKRLKVLGGVVLSGGEPTLFSDLGKVIFRIKQLGLAVKLDTNGLQPDVLKELFAKDSTRPDYIAMDLKTSPHRYRDLLAHNNTASIDPAADLTRSAALIRASGIPHEFRSLNLPIMPVSYFGKEDKEALAKLAQDSPWHIRPFVPGNCLEPQWNEAPLNSILLERNSHGGTEARRMVK